MATYTNEVQDLVEELNRYRNAYYNENISLVSDREYDEKFDRLCKLEKETRIIYANSPTQNVGYEVKSSLSKVKHNHPLLSLAKTTEMREFIEYFGDKTIVLMAKMDGLTCSLLYSEGKLVRAESRGNGEVGEDITHNARVISNIPLEIPFKGELIVDGECIIDYQTFDEINQVENTEYKNPRNLVSGTMRQLNNEIAAKRNVKFIAWRLHSMTGLNGDMIDKNTFSNCFGILSSFGFTVVPHAFVEPKYIASCIEQIRNVCEKNYLPIDGLVGSFNDIAYGLSLGSTSHHPKHSLAFKFYQERNETTLRNIEWSVSRTGLVNPVAVFDPVEIDGTTVSRATLSNVSIIKELELGIGDIVTVIKANQIIPAITENLTKSGTYEIPIVCPCCGKPLTIRCDNGREMLYCENEKCHDRVVDKIVNFCGKNGMDIVGLSRETIDYLVTFGYIDQYADIYNLHSFADELEKANGFGKARVAKLIDAIDKSRTRRLENVIVAIGIPGVGKSSAKAIARYCEGEAPGKDNLLKLFVEYSTSKFDWTYLDDFGETTRDGINRYVSEHLFEIEPLCSILKIEYNDGAALSNTLNGKTFCITGKLEVFPNRNALVAEIEKNGGKVVSGVTAKTDYLITNDKCTGSSKNASAAKYGTEIISEKEFITLCATN